MERWKLVLSLAAIGSCLLAPGVSGAGGGDREGIARTRFLRQLAKSPDGMTDESRRALAAALPSREAALARKSRAEVVAQVRERARLMKVTAPPEEMADLLLRRAGLELAYDRCRAGGEADCSSPLSALRRVENRFRNLAGVSAGEFQKGRPDPQAPPGRKENWYPDHCTCSFNVYSSDRWMSGSWGLECGGHASHGVCSNNVDTFIHTPGIGAMVGSVYIIFSTVQSMECPDDHRSCFKGPSTDHPGEWGNVCSCDTTHSQFYNPYTKFYGGSLQDNEEIYQASGGGLLDGSCEGQWMTVQESIQEHDPGCCDDPMGVLTAGVPLTEGTGSVSVPLSGQNCNGGSQSGVYPNCGNFGATIRVTYSCRTEPDTPTSCQGQCFSDPPDANCSCRPGCMSAGNCCYDYGEACCDTNPNYNGCWS